MRLYREIIHLPLCNFHLHGENKKNESSVWVDIGIRQQKVLLSTAWGILRKTLGCISVPCLPSPLNFFPVPMCISCWLFFFSVQTVFFLLAAFCEKDEVECANHECVPRELWCDGQADCSDSSDEWDCGKLYGLDSNWWSRQEGGQKERKEKLSVKCCSAKIQVK